MANRAQVAPLIVRPAGTPILRAPVQVVHTAPPVHFIHAPNVQLGRGRDLARQGWEAVQRILAFKLYVEYDCGDVLTCFDCLLLR